MSSSSPGHVIPTGDPEDGIHDPPTGVRVAATAASTPTRAVKQKRARDSPASHAPARALAILGSLTETVRTNAARGLRALSSSIERPRSRSSTTTSGDSGLESPTDEVQAVKATPASKRRRTTLSDAVLRRSHADWRGTQWDYTGAMNDKLFYRVADSGPSAFSFPHQRTAEDASPAIGSPGAGESEPLEPVRPPSAMSAASAPAAFSTPRSAPSVPRAPPQPADTAMDEGWVMSVSHADDDPFAFAPPTDAATESGCEAVDAFVSALRGATALLSRDTVGAPDACGALLAFQARLRALDPQGNFVAHCPAGEAAAAELRELRDAVAGIAAAQRECARAVSALSAKPNAPPAPPTQPPHPGDEACAPSPPAHPAPVPPRTPQPPPRPPLPPALPRKTAGSTQPPAQPKAVGRHDHRRAVFRPAVPFAGRIPAPANAESLRSLNATSYAVRDAVNAALRERVAERMSDDAPAPVVVAGVNWTERGNVCMVVRDEFTAHDLLANADAAAAAAQLGPGWRASRDVPVFKVVLRNVPTKRTDGTLFTEDEVLGDLRAHSSDFNKLSLADSAEPASWISRADGRALKDSSALVLNMATEGDAARLLAMSHRLFVFGRACEPDPFQPRERERICKRCWNPLARHSERDHSCMERCRLCGGKHAEEDHTCQTCDVLARPCVHIPLHCVNCGRRHAADDGACEYRRRMRGTAKAAPPMSSGKQGNVATTKPVTPAPGKKKAKGKRVRVLDPHEPFPEDPVPAPAPSPAPPSSPVTLPAPPAGEQEPQDPPAASTSRRKRATKRRASAAPAATPPGSPAPVAIPTPPPVLSTTRESPPPPEVRQDPLPVVAAARSGAARPALDEADAAVIEELIGAADPPAHTPHPPTAPNDTGGSAGAAARRTPSLRVAAGDQDRDTRRRRATHVLHNAFGKLRFSDIYDAIRTCGDDYASAVSWAVEAQAARAKPGMQGKAEKSLQKLVLDMAAAAAKDTPAEDTDNTQSSAHA